MTHCEPEWIPISETDWAPTQPRRAKITCLGLILVPALLLGCLGFYYSQVFRVISFDDPTPTHLTIVKIPPRENHVLHPFRKRTISDIIDPCRVELDNLKIQIEQTKGRNGKYGQLVPPDWDQATTEILNRLIEIMEQARLRRIPERYYKEYLKVLWGVHHTYRATLGFRRYCDPGPPGVRQSAYLQCKKHRKKAISAFKKGREWFTHDAKSVI